MINSFFTRKLFLYELFQELLRHVILLYYELGWWCGGEWCETYPHMTL